MTATLNGIYRAYREARADLREALAQWRNLPFAEKAAFHAAIVAPAAERVDALYNSMSEYERLSATGVS